MTMVSKTVDMPEWAWDALDEAAEECHIPPDAVLRGVVLAWVREHINDDDDESD